MSIAAKTKPWSRFRPHLLITDWHYEFKLAYSLVITVLYHCCRVNNIDNIISFTIHQTNCISDQKSLSYLRHSCSIARCKMFPIQSSFTHKKMHEACSLKDIQIQKYFFLLLYCSWILSPTNTPKIILDFAVHTPFLQFISLYDAKAVELGSVFHLLY